MKCINIGMLAAMMLTGCPAAVPVVGPTSDCTTAVIEDAVAGMPIKDIVAKEKDRCIKDGILDVETVIAILLKTSDPRVPTTRAYGEARAAHADGGV